jgi:catechol 2,3-dioxygenase-like lactoylglutathione lyase family enzyme
MSVVINHIVVHCHNKEASASFLADILGLPEPTTFHRFQVVRLDNGATLDFLDSPDNEIVWEHFAFLVDESDFDAILSRIKMRNVQFWAEPFGTRLGEINNDDGGRSLYFKDPNNHLIEILTVPYGGERLAAKYVA